MLKFVSASCFFFRPLRHNSAYKNIFPFDIPSFFFVPKSPRCKLPLFLPCRSKAERKNGKNIHILFWGHNFYDKNKNN